MACGVYALINAVNFKIYIGCSVEIEKRVASHFKQLANGVHPNVEMQEEYNFYGEKMFFSKTLKTCHPEDRFYIEQQFMNLYETTSPNFGYNITAEIHKNVSQKPRLLKKETITEFPVISPEKEWDDYGVLNPCDIDDIEDLFAHIIDADILPHENLFLLYLTKLSVSISSSPELIKTTISNLSSELNMGRSDTKTVLQSLASKKIISFLKHPDDTDRIKILLFPERKPGLVTKNRSFEVQFGMLEYGKSKSHAIKKCRNRLDIINDGCGFKIIKCFPINSEEDWYK